VKWKNKYLVAVALLAVLAVVFGLAGTVIPMSEPPLSSSSSDSVTHFMNPPTYNSSWLDITDKAGQYFNVTHNLNSTDVIVDITGRTIMDGRAHQRHLGGTDYVQGWNRTYGGASDEYCTYSLIETSDGGYVTAGNTYSFGAGVDDFWLVKTDAGGNVEWNQTYGGANTELANSVIQTSDGGYAIAGWAQSFGAGGHDFWLIKTDQIGNMQWNQTYGGAYDDNAYSVIQTSDGGYAIAGGTSSSGAGGTDFWLIKTDETGNMQWSQTYGGGNFDDASEVIQTSDGGYAMGGTTASFGAGGYDFWLIKTNSTGDAQWDKTFGGSGQDIATGVVQTTGGGYALVGYTTSFGPGTYAIWLIKTNSSGDTQWSKTYGGINTEIANSVVQSRDGGYVIAGRTNSFGAGGENFWLVKTDSNGNAQWNQTYGGANSETAGCAIQTSDGGYAIAGWTQSFGAGGWDFWLIKTDQAGNAYPSFKFGLAWIDSTADTITLYRGATDLYWNYVRVRIWLIKEPTWQFGDINQDGIVDAKDLAIIGKNYGKTFSALSTGGIIAIAGIYIYKKRKQPK